MHVGAVVMCFPTGEGRLAQLEEHLAAPVCRRVGIVGDHGRPENAQGLVDESDRRLAVALAERGRDHDSLCAGATRRTHDRHIDQRAAKRQRVSVMQEVCRMRRFVPTCCSARLTVSRVLRWRSIERFGHCLGGKGKHADEEGEGWSHGHSEGCRTPAPAS